MTSEIRSPKIYFGDVARGLQSEVGRRRARKDAAIVGTKAVGATVFVDALISFIILAEGLNNFPNPFFNVLPSSSCIGATIFSLGLIEIAHKLSIQGALMRGDARPTRRARDRFTSRLRY